MVCLFLLKKSKNRLSRNGAMSFLGFNIKNQVANLKQKTVTIYPRLTTMNQI